MGMSARCPLLRGPGNPCILGDARLSDTTLPFEERFYAVAEIARIWNLSEDSVRRLFAGEPGVLHIRRTLKGKTQRRPSTTLRIPQSVVERMHKRYSLVK